MGRIINNNDRKTLLSGALSMGIATIIVKILSVLYKIPMLNTLGEEGMGYFNTAYTIYSFFYIVCTAGVPKAITILLSSAKERGEDDEYKGVLRTAFSLFLIIGLLLSLAFLALASLIARSVGSPRSVYSMIVIAPSLVIVALTGVLRGYLSSVGRLGSISVSQILEGVAKLCLGLLLSRYSVEIGLGAPMCAAVAIVGIDLGALVAMLYMFIIYKKEKANEKTKQKLNLSEFKEYSKSIFSISIPITITSAVMSISSIIDLFMIMSRLKATGYSEVASAALYGNYTTLAVPMFNLCISLITPLSIAYLPRLASCFARGNKEAYFSTMRSFCTVTMLAAAFLFSVVAFFPRQVLYFIFGDNGYSLGAELLSRLAPSVPIYSLLIVVNTSLEARGRVKIPLISMLIGSIIKIPVEYLLLSNADVNISGAAYSTNITYLTALVISIVFAIKYSAFRLRDAFSGAAYLGCAVLGALVLNTLYTGSIWHAESRLETILLIPLFLICYTVLSISVIASGYLFGKKCQIAQKKV